MAHSNDFIAYNKYCATIAWILKKEKRPAWKTFFTNLNLPATIHHL
jgi:hypothetical protein